MINASSLGNGHDMTPLDVRSPDGATLEQVLYAENKMFGDDNGSSHKQSNLDRDSKDGDYRDHGDNEADDDGAMDLGGKGTGGQLRKRANAMLFFTQMMTATTSTTRTLTKTRRELRIVVVTRG